MWFFRKKEDYETKLKLKLIEEALQKSFSNIKKDILKVNNTLNNHEQAIELIKDNLQTLLNQPITIKTDTKEEEIESKEEYQPKIIWEDLTNVQQSIFSKLALLQIESSQKWVSLKYLAEELYPNKDYNSIRSMISDYVNLLIEFGLVKKIRKGRQTYISLSERGLNYLDKAKEKKLLKIIK